VTTPTAQGNPGHSIPLASVPNLRDLGGYTTADGWQVRTGALYRSVALDRLADVDLPTFAALGIRTVFDLRTADERAAAPDRRLPGVREVVLDVLAGSPDTAPAQLEALLNDPVRATEELGQGRAELVFERAYREIVTLPSAHTAYHAFYTDLLEEDPLPGLFHCTTGKDRTGWAAAATLLVLGVREDDVFADYLATNDQLLPALRPLFDQFVAGGGDQAVLLPVLGVRREYLEAALDEVRAHYGDLNRYFEVALGITEDARVRLRSALLV
jgi:protein-tyrosine phosphatase